MKWLDSISELASHYDAFLLDLWGVVHDGTQLYPSSAKTLKRLYESQKKIVFISNAPRRAMKVQSVLEGFGVQPGEYMGAVSSGEAAYRWLAEKRITPGKNYFYIGPERDADVLGALQFTPTSIAQADFILNVGYGSEAQTSDAWMTDLQQCRARGLLMLCLNPDIEVVKISGERYPCAGAIARDYESLGGKVEYFGKPYPQVYEMAYELLPGVPKNRMLVVGDSLHTDIAGATREGIASVLITGGILRQDLGEMNAEKISSGNFIGLCHQHDCRPDYVMSEFSWI